MIEQLFELVTDQRMTYAESLKYFRDKLALPPSEFFALRAHYRALAFTVSGYSSLGVLQEFQQSIGRAIEDGTTMETFRREMNTWLTDKGYQGITPYQAETVFRNNVQTAYSVGAYREMTSPHALKHRPYWRYNAVEDSATRPTHLAMNNRVFPADSAVWNTWYPPNGHRCRCWVDSLTQAQVERQGLTVESKVPDRVSMGMGVVTMLPDRGFGYNPATVAYQPDLEGIPKTLVTAYERREATRREN